MRVVLALGLVAGALALDDEVVCADGMREAVAGSVETFCEDAAAAVFDLVVGCVDASEACGANATFAHDNDWRILVFPDACLPDGFNENLLQRCPTPDGSCLEGEMAVMGTPVDGLCPPVREIGAPEMLGCVPESSSCGPYERTVTRADREGPLYRVSSSCVPDGYWEIAAGCAVPVGPGTDPVAMIAIGTVCSVAVVGMGALVYRRRVRSQNRPQRL